MKYIIGIIVLFSACAGDPPQVIGSNDPRVERVVIADPQDVQSACWVPGRKNDQGNKMSPTDSIGGCYDEESKTIFLSRACELFQVWAHELCHAISGLSDKECDDRYPVKCLGYRFSQGSEHAGGRR